MKMDNEVKKCKNINNQSQNKNFYIKIAYMHPTATLPSEQISLLLRASSCQFHRPMVSHPTEQMISQLKRESTENQCHCKVVYGGEHRIKFKDN